MFAQHHRPVLLTLLRFVVATSLLFITLALLYNSINTQRFATRGIESNMNTRTVPPASPALGTSLNLVPYATKPEIQTAVARLASTGLQGFSQVFPWDKLEPQEGEYDWTFSDSVIHCADAKDLQIVAILTRSPYWARSEWNADNTFAPPENMDDFAAFCAAFAERYAGSIAGYQIWDQPNIAPHWGNGPVNPSEYVQMLRTTAPAIRSADPSAIVIGGGMAPTTENSALNISDVTFLQEICRRGAGEYFDVLGAKAYGFWTGPYDRKVDEQTLNFSRILLLREELVHQGYQDSPIWILEGGWVALDEAFEGTPSSTGSDSSVVQAQRLEQGILRIREEWPWIGFTCLQTLQPPRSSVDPTQGLAMFTQDGSRTSLGDVMTDMASPQQTLYPGVTSPSNDYLSPNLTDQQAEAHIYGTSLWVKMAPEYTNGLKVAVDQLHTDVEIDAPDTEDTWIRVASRLSLNEHTIVFKGDAQTRQAIEAIYVSSNHINLGYSLNTAIAIAMAVWQAIVAISAAIVLPWRKAWQRLAGYWDAFPQTAQWIIQIAFLLAIYGLSGSWFALLAVAAYGVVCLFRPQQATWLAIAAIPFAPLYSNLVLGQFGIAEIAVLCASAAVIWNLLMGKLRLQSIRLGIMDWLIIALVVISAISAIAAAYQHVALREFRVVIAESAMLYALVRVQKTSRRNGLGTLDFLWIGGTLVALYALAIYPTTWGVIEAEGVRRARAFYGSPNNLALVLERLWPLGLAMAIWAKTRWRRWAYGLSAGLMLVALMLTFSRGAIFFAIPAAGIALTTFMSKRWRIAVLAALVICIIVAIPIVGPERLGTMLNPQSGTTGLRIALWQASVDMLKEHFVLGIGPDNFLYYYGDYILESASIDPNLSHPHNLILDFWLRLGILGPVILLAILITYTKQLLKTQRQGLNGNKLAIAIGLSAGLAASVVHGLGDSFYFVTELAMWLMLTLAWMQNASVAVNDRE